MKLPLLIIVQLIIFSNCMNAQWQFIDIGTSRDLYTVHFINKDTGFIGGYNTFLQTFDGGNSWSQNASIDQDSFIFYDMDFPSKTIGYLVGGGTSNVAVFKTIDGGTTWNDISPIWDSQFYSVSFLNQDTGFACGLGTKIYETFDGGINWQAIFPWTLGGPYFVWMQFTSVDTGYVCTRESTGDGGLQKTIDNGINLNPAWMTAFFVPWIPYKNFQFFNGDYGYSGISGVKKTENGGNNWTQLFITNVFSLSFLTRDTGYVAGDNGFATAIYKTFDAGDSWFQCATQYPDSQYYVFEIDMVNGSCGYIVGATGLFMRTSNGGGFNSVSEIQNTVLDFSLSPNPASSQLTISFSSKNFSPVQLIIQNMLGEIVHEEEIPCLAAGKSSSHKVIDVSALPAGVYLIEVKTKDGSATKKFVKQ